MNRFAFLPMLVLVAGPAVGTVVPAGEEPAAPALSAAAADPARSAVRVSAPGPVREPVLSVESRAVRVAEERPGAPRPGVPSVPLGLACALAFALYVALRRLR